MRKRRRPGIAWTTQERRDDCEELPVGETCPGTICTASHLLLRTGKKRDAKEPPELPGVPKKETTLLLPLARPRVQHEEGAEREPQKVIPAREETLFGPQQSPDTKHEERERYQDPEVYAPAGDLPYSCVERAKERGDAASQGWR